MIFNSDNEGEALYSIVKIEDFKYIDVALSSEGNVKLSIFGYPDFSYNLEEGQ